MSDIPTMSDPAEVAAAAALRVDRDEPPLAGPTPPTLDDWELDELLRQIARMLATEAEDPPDRKHSRLDAAHRSSRRPRRSDWGAKLRRVGQQIETVHTRRVLPILAWVATLLGTMAAVCGGVLVAWSMVSGRHELWRIGFPTALGGATSLALGILLQLDRLWQRRRAAAPPAHEAPTAAAVGLSNRGAGTAGQDSSGTRASSARKPAAGGPPGRELAIDAAHPAPLGELALPDLSMADDSPLPAPPGSSYADG